MLSRIAISAVVAALTVAAGLQPASAQRYDDRNQNGYDGGSRDRGSNGRNTAGDFDYYALVMSWSPTHCASTQRDDDTQCNRSDGRRYNFVLHGLWPQYERGFPGDCDIGRRPFVPDRVIEETMDVMPSRPLIIHEYRKHGTCSGLDPANYFDLSERLFRTIKIPERYVNPFEEQSVAPGDLLSEFLALNKQLKPDQIVVVCDGSRNRLKEVRVCMNPKGEPRSCGRNENQRRLCSASRIYVPPVRSSSGARTDGPNAGHRNDGGRRDTAPSRRYDGESPLPGPRMDRYHDERSL